MAETCDHCSCWWPDAHTCCKCGDQPAPIYLSDERHNPCATFAAHYNRHPPEEKRD